MVAAKARMGGQLVVLAPPVIVVFDSAAVNLRQPATTQPITAGVITSGGY